MRRRIKPIVVWTFFGVILLSLLLSHSLQLVRRQSQLTKAKRTIPQVAQKSKRPRQTTTSVTKDDQQETIKPIIDVSGWQRPSEIDYDVLAQHISAAIVRVFGGSGIEIDNNATDATGVDKTFAEHLSEFQKRGIPTAVYAYVMGKSEQEMREEARILYKQSASYQPSYYWLDVEESTMSDMNAGVEAFRDELDKLGAKNIGIYIGTYFKEEQQINTDKFDALWIPTYGSDSGDIEEIPNTNLDYDLHQYTSQGFVSGFDKVLDLNQIAPHKDGKKTFKKLFGVEPK